MAGKSKGTNIVVWIILVLLIVGLGGFGVTNFSGTVNSVGSVGDRDITVQRYARELQGQLNGLNAQLGTNLTLSQAQGFGIDQAVLQRLVANAAIEAEAGTVGLSVGDEEVRRQVLNMAEFQGINGSFDREAYRFMLDQNGLNERQFEADLRAEMARTLVQGAVIGGISTPDIYPNTMLNFIGQRRDFSFATLGPDALETGPAEPSDADLRAYFDANQDDFMLPETRAITYAWLTPDMLVDTIEIDEEALRALYDQRIDEFVRPERRLVERLILGDAADDARARLDADEVSFEELAAERELELADIDLGDVTAEDLDAAGEAVFAVAEPGIVGPVDTPLGPALFRVNAILTAQETSFEDARDTLVGEFALDRARRVIGEMIEEVDDLLAGGATLEELADETEMRLGQTNWAEGATGGIAGYDAFREAATLAQEGDFPEVAQLEDGGIFALRVDEIVAPRLQDFADATPRAAEDWRAAETARLLAETTQALAERMRNGEDAAALGLDLQMESDITRERFIPDTPADFLTTVFEMEPGELRVVEAPTAAYLIKLHTIAEPDTDDPDYAANRQTLLSSLAQGVGADLLAAYSNAVTLEAGIEINQPAINAVHAQFP